MKKILCIVFIVFTFVFCATQSATSGILFEQEIRIPALKFGGMFHIDDNFYFYSIEPTSKKQLLIYDNKVELLKEISLKTIPYIDMCSGVDIFDFNRIALSIGSPLQIVYLIDSTAKIQGENFVPQFVLVDSVKKIYRYVETYKSFYDSVDNSILAYNIFFSQNSSTSAFDVKQLAEKYPLMLKIPFRNCEQIENIGENKLCDMYEEETDVYENGYCFVVGNYILYSYSKSLVTLVFDRKNNTFIKKIKSTTKLLKPTKTKKNIQANHYPIYIMDICWNKVREEYYMLLVGDSDMIKDNNYILQVFDKDFKYEREVKLPRVSGNDDYVYRMLSDGDRLVVKFSKNKSEDEFDYYNVYTINF